jgi:hypothetical protein
MENEASARDDEGAARKPRTYDGPILGSGEAAGADQGGSETRDGCPFSRAEAAVYQLASAEPHADAQAHGVFDDSPRILQPGNYGGLDALLVGGTV